MSFYDAWFGFREAFRLRPVLVFESVEGTFALVRRDRCPRCGPGPSGGSPIPAGAPWICVECGQVGRIEPDGLLRRPTEGELFAIMLSAQWDDLSKVERVVLRGIEERYGSARRTT